MAIVFLLLLGSWKNLAPAENDLLLRLEVRNFTTDVFGNLYVTDRSNTVFKYDRDGNFVIRANYKIYGDLAYIDASNPFELYWYYRDQQKLVFTDNQLSQRGVLDLSRISHVEAGAVCRSFDNGFWVFDGADMRLLKLNKELKVQQESPVSATWAEQQWWPLKMVEDGKNVFVLDSSLGIAVFDVFGQYGRTIRVKGITDFQVQNGKVIYTLGGVAMEYDPVFFDLDTLLMVNGMRAVRTEKERIYICSEEGIWVKSETGKTDKSPR